VFPIVSLTNCFGREQTQYGVKDNSLIVTICLQFPAALCRYSPAHSRELPGAMHRGEGHWEDDREGARLQGLDLSQGHPGVYDARGGLFEQKW
jgi:hypothetical protein